MSAQLTSSRDFSDQTKLAVSFRLLLSLYSIIPICLILQWIDTGFWQGYLKESLPSSPEHFILFQILFGTPHIIASAIVLTSNSDYVKFYKRRLIWMSAAIICFFGLGSLFLPYRVLYILVACWTVFHVLKQQHGVARGVCRLPAWAFHLLLWLSIAAGILIYLGIFLKNGLDPQQAAEIKRMAAILSVALLLATALSQRYAASRSGKWFMWSNTLLVLSSYYLYAQQYYFFAILVPRLVHDATAYIFYITHDYNKHRQQPQNWIYRLARRFKVHYFIVLPLISFGLAFVLQAYGNDAAHWIAYHLFGMEIRKAVTLGLLGFLGLMHYYTESFTWKLDSPYRKFISFTH
jgi:hypothetical protein